MLAEDESGDRRVSSIVLPVSDDEATGTEVGDLIGTVGYMAPEQARGLPAGPAADVYALAATLFELLTLARLHSPDPLEAMKELRHGVEARPSRRVPDQRIAHELEELCVSATSRDPADRPDAQSMHDAIQEFLDGERDQAPLSRRRQHRPHRRAGAPRPPPPRFPVRDGTPALRSRRAPPRARARRGTARRAEHHAHGDRRRAAPVAALPFTSVALASRPTTRLFPSRRRRERSGGHTRHPMFSSTAGGVACGRRSVSPA